ncbi:MAG: hypothetical protein IPJ46_04325 [Anaerolineales bacterium]|nr:hypothetical protein [Anaerolineales bacterium]
MDSTAPQLGLVNACHSGVVCPADNASEIKVSITSPFSQCAMTSMPFSFAILNALKIPPSSSRNFPL